MSTTRTPVDGINTQRGTDFEETDDLQDLEQSVFEPRRTVLAHTPPRGDVVPRGPSRRARSEGNSEYHPDISLRESPMDARRRLGLPSLALPPVARNLLNDLPIEREEPEDGRRRLQGPPASGDAVNVRLDALERLVGELVEDVREIKIKINPTQP